MWPMCFFQVRCKELDRRQHPSINYCDSIRRSLAFCSVDFDFIAVWRNILITNGRTTGPFRKDWPLRFFQLHRNLEKDRALLFALSFSGVFLAKWATVGCEGRSFPEWTTESQLHVLQLLNFLFLFADLLTCFSVKLKKVCPFLLPFVWTSQ